MTTEKYDIVIIGSGLGGLLCGYTLSQEGYKVCVLEKNKQIGGSLQTFARDRVHFDTGVHYIGGLQEGQPLYQYFKYFGLIGNIKLKRMDEHGFEEITVAGESKKYQYGMGYVNFKNGLKIDFPDEAAAIDEYCAKIIEICKGFPMYNVENGDDLVFGTDVLYIGAKQYLEQLTPNVRLQNVLAATNILYAGDAAKTPLYVHALVVNSYIESSYRLIDGSAQIASVLSKNIRQKGGKVFSNAEVVKLHMDENDEKIKNAEIKNGNLVEADHFISDVHPILIMDMLETSKIRKVYRNRIAKLENTTSVFIINAVMNKDTFPYFNHNIYHYETEDVWCTSEYKPEEWPMSYALYTAATSKSETHTEAVSIMAYMKMEDVAPWLDTFNTVSEKEDRGAEYELFKIEKAEKLLDLVEKKFPDFRKSMKAYYVSTPLTYRDYIGTKDGSLYGIKKDFADPLSTFISTRTKIPNLLMTGQNLHMHGVYGVTVGAIKTCSELLGQDYLLNKVKNS